MDTLAIIKRIEMRIAEIGMSKAEFYKKSGISSASFSQWNTGLYNPSKKKLECAASCLNVSYEYLVNGEETKKAPTTDGERHEDSDIRRIERAKSRMTEKEWNHQMEIIRASFGDYFSDDYEDDDLDE